MELFIPDDVKDGDHTQAELVAKSHADQDAVNKSAGDSATSKFDS